MSDLKKLLEGLRIEVKGKDEVELDGVTYYRSRVQFAVEDANCSPLVRLAGRVILRLMNEYEETKPKDLNRCAVCGWPLADSIGKGCTRGNCSQRPLLERDKWYDRDRALIEIYGDATPKPKPVPTWEPGTVLVKKAEPLSQVRLDKFIRFNRSKEIWAATWLDLNSSLPEAGFYPIDWAVHRLPHEFRVGDWFECDYCKEERKPYGPFKVTSITRNDRIYDNRDTLALNHAPDSCRHVPAPRKEDPFTGAHWDRMRDWQRKRPGHLLPMADITDCLCDLRDELRRLKEEK